MLILSAPLVISLLAQSGMTLTDTLMAGRHSDISLAGVAVGSSLWMPIMLSLMGILMAVTPFVAQAFGAGRYREVKWIVQQGFWLSLVLGVLFMGILQQSGFVFDLLDISGPVRGQAQGYTEAIAWGLPATAAFQVLRSLNEGFHQTRPYMLVSLVALLCNIPLNYILIYGHFGLPELGGVGCGWATAISLWLQLFMLLGLTLMDRRRFRIKLFRHWRRPDPRRLGALLQLGLPMGVALLIETSMFSLIALFLATLGATVVAGHQVAFSFITLSFMLPLSLSTALTIRCGYQLGRGQPELARISAQVGLVIALFIACLTTLLMFLLPAQIAGLYTDSLAVQEVAVSLLFLAAIFHCADALQVVAAGALRGYKDTRIPFLVVLMAFWIIGLPLGYILGMTDLLGAALGARGFWIGLIAGLSSAALLLCWRLAVISLKSIEESPLNITH